MLMGSDDGTPVFVAVVAAAVAADWSESLGLVLKPLVECWGLLAVV